MNKDIRTSEIFPTNYDAFRNDRDLNGGGVFIATRSDIITSPQTSLSTECELVWAKVQFNNRKPLYIGSFYRPPNSSIKELEQLNLSLDKLQNQLRSLPSILFGGGGDFNLPSIDWGNNCVKSTPQYGMTMNSTMLDIANDHALTQHVNSPTRGSNMLDLFFSTNPDLVHNVSVIPGISDHDIVTLDVNTKLRVNKKKPRQVFVYRKGNMTGVKTDIANLHETLLKENEPNTEKLWCKFRDTILTAMEKHIPQKRLSGKTNLPWLSRNTKRKMNERKRLYDRARQTQNPDHWKDYRNVRNIVKRMLEKAHNDYIKDLLNVAVNEKPKKFWSYIKSLGRDFVGISPLQADGKLHADSTGKAEALNHQYESVFTDENLQDEPSKGQSQHPSMPDINVSSQGIQKLLENLQISKASGPDRLPIRILKECATEIAPVLQIIFMQSLNTGQVPEDWRTADICAIFKKGERSDPANYRPVSLTSVSCKILEHVIFHSIMKHLDLHNILVNFQHGFRAKHSCESQLINTVENLARSMDNRKQIDIHILDFSKAFDTVPHQRLLHKIQYYGIRGGTCNWIRNWLTQRTQRVVIDGDGSEKVKVRSGVPQGTVLGPLMFLLYINDIGDGLSCNIKLFADDCILFRTIDTTCITDATSLQADLDTVTRWSEQWQMIFNPDKCYVMSMHRSKKPIITEYTMKGKILKSVKHHPYLGVELQPI